MFSEWTETDYQTKLWNNNVGHKAKDNPSQDFLTVNGTVTDHDT